MRSRTRPWGLPAVALLAAETLVLFAAYLVLDLGGRIRGSVESPFLRAVAAEVLSVVQNVLPPWLRSSVLGFASVTGLGSLSDLIRGLASLHMLDLSGSSFGGAIVAPVYFAVRRILRTGPVRSVPPTLRGIHWRIRLPKASELEPATVPSARGVASV